MAFARPGEDHLVTGELVSPDGARYEVREGIPHLIDQSREAATPEETREQEYYEATAASYDAVLDWVFESFGEDEVEVREALIDLLELEPMAAVLEIGAGTCRDTVVIADRLDPDGRLFVQDLSPSMLSIGRDRMQTAGKLDHLSARTEFFVGHASHLPFPDDLFDAAFHFGGLNVFSDPPKALVEMARVVRRGGKVVVGDEGLAPWLRDTEYGRILMNSTKLYRHEPPLAEIPSCARDTRVQWIIGSAYFVIDMRVGDGPPAVDLDLPILGARGGSHRTRYFGALEGVTPEAKRLAEISASASGLTMHEWLDRVVRAAAESGPPDSAP
ncbi:MAG: class I SAM-dependent methyltransferase [Solirubrobacteraceae bacterium]